MLNYATLPTPSFTKLWKQYGKVCHMIREAETRALKLLALGEVKSCFVGHLVRECEVNTLQVATLG